MITLHRLNRQEFVLNADLIETIETTPDTLITLTNGKKLMVRDGLADVIDKVINYRRLCSGAIQVVHTEKSETANAGEVTGPNENHGSELPKTGARGGGN